MAYAKILVPLTGADSDGLALATAFAAAAPFAAHVEGLFVHADPRDLAASVFGGGAPIAPEIVQSIIDGQTKLATDAQHRAHSALTAAAKDAGVPIERAREHNATGSCSFHVRFGFIPHAVADAARFSDLVVFKPIAGDERPEFATALLDTLAQAGRPVVLSAQKRIASFARRVVIGWDGRDAAARAATAALPYLKRADKVEILTAQPQGQGTITGAGALKEYLAFHGVNATLRDVDRDHHSVSECLLNSAVKGDADLVVIGGYGHSHLRETILGGVTLDIVSNHALPIFLAH